MNTWLVMINATKYNLFGAARKYGDGIPWFFDGTTGAAVDDKVLFYLTSSEPSEDKGYGENIIGSLYKRVVFEGIITETGADLSKADIDAEYWDKEHAEELKKNCKELVMIKIVKTLYDNNNANRITLSKERWVENRKTYVVKI